jgi:hypothetical protein
MTITFKSVGWTRKLDPNYESKKKQYYERKTNRPYRRKENAITPERRHLEVLLAVSKKRALQRGLIWELDLDQLTIPTTCPYLGVPLTYIHGEGRVQSNISLDRIDSTKGYTMDNVEFISDLANRMKQEATQEQLISFAHGVLFRLKK